MKLAKDAAQKNLEPPDQHTPTSRPNDSCTEHVSDLNP